MTNQFTVAVARFVREVTTIVIPREGHRRLRRGPPYSKAFYPTLSSGTTVPVSLAFWILAEGLLLGLLALASCAGPPGPRAATRVVAAHDALDRKGADYVARGKDNQRVINAAIAALPPTGGKLSLSEGTFIVSGPILITKPVAIVGSGAYGGKTRHFDDRGITEIVVAAGANTDAIRREPFNDDTPGAHWQIELKDFAINGNREHNGSGNGIVLDYVDAYLSNVRVAQSIVNVWAQGNGGPGVYLDNVYGTTLNLYARSNAMNAFPEFRPNSLPAIGGGRANAPDTISAVRSEVVAYNVRYNTIQANVEVYDSNPAHTRRAFMIGDKFVNNRLLLSARVNENVQNRSGTEGVVFANWGQLDLTGSVVDARSSYNFEYPYRFEVAEQEKKLMEFLAPRR